MLDLFEELTSILRALDARGIDYALCGGLAMAGDLDDIARLESKD